MTRPVSKHGALGILLGLVTLVVPGAVALVVGVLRDSLPVEWLQYQPPLTEGSARGVALLIGVLLLVVAKAYFSFWRVGWLGYVVWATVSAATFIQGLLPESRGIVFQVFPMIVVLGLAYLWARRRDFGIGPQPNVGR